MRYVAQIEGKVYNIDVDETAETLQVQINGEPTAVDLRQVTVPGLLSLLRDGRSYEVFAEPADGGYEILLDTSETPDLTEWADRELVPMAKEWYPKIVAMLPSEGYEAPKEFSITLDKDAKGVAFAGGGKITCAVDWFRKNLEGEAVGAVVHEMVHIVQNYGWGRRNMPEGERRRTPGWITEGIPDYIRWFLYEPETKGAEITARTNDLSGELALPTMLDHHGRAGDVFIAISGGGTSQNILDAITVSAGIAQVDESHSNAGELLRAADQALYAAKHGGRDRVVVNQPELSPGKA